MSDDPIKLTDDEREALLFGFGIRFYENADRTRFAQGVAAVESIVAARVQALTAERDEIDAVMRKIAYEDVPSIAAQRDKAEAELAAANTRCAELEALVDGMHREVDRIGAENLRHLATLDRVTATLALYDDHPETETFVGKEAKRVIVALCAALTPEGTE